MVTHLVKSESKWEGARGSEAPDTSTVQRPLCAVCKQSLGPVTNNRGSACCGGRAKSWRAVNDQWFLEKHQQSSSHLERKEREEHKNHNSLGFFSPPFFLNLHSTHVQSKKPHLQGAQETQSNTNLNTMKTACLTAVWQNKQRGLLKSSTTILELCSQMSMRAPRWKTSR